MKMFFLAAFSFLAAIDVVFLDQIPWAATVDDGTYAAASYSFVRTGRAGWPMMKGLFGLERDFISCGRISAAAVGLSQMTLGTSSFAARLPSLLVVGLSAVLLYWLALEAAMSRPLALIASLLWFVSVPARLLAHSSRPDAFVMLFGVGAALLLLRAVRARRRPLLLLAGVIAGFSLEAHLVGSCLVFTLAVSAWLLSPPAEKLRNAVVVLLGAAGPALLWLWVHRWSQPDLWRWQWEGLLGPGAGPPVLAGPLAVARSALRRYAGYYWEARYHRYLLELLFLLAATVWSWRRIPAAKPLAVLFLVFHLFLGLLAPLPHHGYMAVVFPLACVLITAAFFGSARRWARLAGAGLFAFYLLQTAYWLARSTPPLPERARADVLRHVGGSPWMAADSLWFHFPDQPNLRSIVCLNFLPFYAPQLSWSAAFEQYLRQERIRFLAVDAVFEHFLGAPQAKFLAERTSLVQEYRYGRAGWIRIYRLSLP